MRSRFSARRLSSSVLLLALVAGSALEACDKPRASANTVATTMEAAPDPDTGVVLHRADWDAFEERLSRDPAIAASDLERYRRLHGLPFNFFLTKAAPAALERAYSKSVDGGDEAPCGSGLRIFARRFPRDNRAFAPSPVIELDSAGRVLRQWPMPNDVDYWDIVEGVEGDELIASYPHRRGVYMRVKPTGDYRISSTPPPPLPPQPPQEWIALPESTWVRVSPTGETYGSYHSIFTRGVEPGRWIPHGDSGWYERVDPGPDSGTLARSVKRPAPAEPKGVACPPGQEAMICREYPDGRRVRVIAVPTICS